MNNNATIEIITFEEGDLVTHVNSECSFYRQNGTTYIEYQVVNENKTCIAVSDNLISISRIGEESYTMVLEKDKAHSFCLISALGRLPLNSKLHNLKLKESLGIYELLFSYIISDDSNDESKTKIRLKCQYAN